MAKTKTFQEKLIDFLFPWIPIHISCALLNLILVFFRLEGLKFGLDVDGLLYFFVMVGLGTAGLSAMVFDFGRFMSIKEAEPAEGEMALLDEEEIEPRRKGGIAWFYNLVFLIDHAFLFVFFPYSGWR